MLSSRVMILSGSQIRSDVLFEHFMVAASQAFWKRVEGSNGSESLCHLISRISHHM